LLTTRCGYHVKLREESAVMMRANLQRAQQQRAADRLPAIPQALRAEQLLLHRQHPAWVKQLEM
jgi:hypothetical protein